MGKQHKLSKKIIKDVRAGNLNVEEGTILFC